MGARLARTLLVRSTPGLLTGKDDNMLRWALIFFIVALVAAVFGFGGIAAGAAGVAKILFFAFLVLAVVSLVAGRLRSTNI